MLYISKYQMDKMAQHRLKEFVSRTTRRLRAEYPAELHEAGYLGEGLESQVASWVNEARSYGLRSRSRMDDFVDACVLARGKTLFSLHPQLRCLGDSTISVEDKVEILHQTLVFGY